MRGLEGLQAGTRCVVHIPPALAYGAGPVPPCDVVVGPGNRWVTAAKKLVAGDVGIDMLAGPSELVVLADDTADPGTVAADLLAQAEHDPLATALLITPSARLAAEVQTAVKEQLPSLARRSIIEASLAGQGAILVVDDLDQALARFPTFDHVVELIRANRDVKLLVEVETCLRLAGYQPGRIEFAPTEDAPRDLAQRLGQRLQDWTGNRWAVSVVNEGLKASIVETRNAEKTALESEARDHPLVQAVFDAFPKAKILEIRSAADIAAEAQVEALQEVEDEWDPFEED